MYWRGYFTNAMQDGIDYSCVLHWLSHEDSKTFWLRVAVELLKLASTPIAKNARGIYISSSHYVTTAPDFAISAVQEMFSWLVL